MPTSEAFDQGLLITEDTRKKWKQEKKSKELVL
jgi:hypothetical protein